MSSNPKDSQSITSSSNFSNIAAVVGLLGLGFVAGVSYQASLADKLLAEGRDFASIQTSLEPTNTAHVVYQDRGMARAEYLISNIDSDSTNEEINIVVSTMFDDYLCWKDPIRDPIERASSPQDLVRTVLGHKGFTSISNARILPKIYFAMESLELSQGDNYAGVKLGDTKCYEVPELK
jgi:hypothetical protein